MHFVRYLLVQVLAYGLDMGGFVLMFTHFGVDPLMANMTSKVLAGLFAFVAHRNFTFDVSAAGSKARQAVRYFVLLALNIPISAVVLGAVLWMIPTTVLAKLVADVICVFVTYWLSKRYVFLSEGGGKEKFVKEGGAR